MARNESKLDRIVRAVSGVALIGAGVAVGGGALSVVLYALAGILLVTAAVGFCPLYALLHLNTCKAAGECA